MVRRLPRERKIPGSNPTCAGIFSGLSHTSDLKIGTPLATLPGTWRYRVGTGTGQPGVSILWLGEVEHLICNFYLSVAARKIVWADPSLRYTSMLLGRLSNQQTTTSSSAFPSLISGVHHLGWDFCIWTHSLSLCLSLSHALIPTLRTLTCTSCEISSNTSSWLLSGWKTRSKQNSYLLLPRRLLQKVLCPQRKG